MAEEAAGTIAKNLPPEVCLQALSPVLREAEFPVNLAALKMIMKVQLSLTTFFLPNFLCGSPNFIYVLKYFRQCK